MKSVLLLPLLQVWKVGLNKSHKASVKVLVSLVSDLCLSASEKYPLCPGLLQQLGPT